LFEFDLEFVLEFVLELLHDWTLLRDCLFCLSSLSMERAEAEAAAARPNATRRIGALRILRL